MILEKDILIVLPIVLPLLSAIIMILSGNKIVFHKIVNLISTILQLVTGLLLLNIVTEQGIFSLTIGNWKAPFGISLVVDGLSAIMITMSAILSVTAAIFSSNTIGWYRKRYFFYPLFQFLLLGVNGSFLTGDVFNLYVWFEVMLISSFVLLALGGKQEQLEGAMKYVTINLLSSTIFLSAAGITYGLAGTLNMADLSLKLPFIENQGLVNVLSVLFLISFGIKSAIFPLYFWLPASYHTPPVAVSALFAGLLTKVGVYVLFRFYTLIFVNNIDFTHNLILILSAFTMILGVFGAIAQNDFRRILSFHIISQVGYMIFALGIYTKEAIAAGIYYIMYHMLVKTNLFYSSGIVYNIKGSYSLNELGGVYKNYPVVSIVFLISALALSGIPPLAGFWAKLTVAIAGFNDKEYFITALSLLAGILTLVSMTKIWNNVFWKDAPQLDSLLECEKKKKKKSFNDKFQLYLPSGILLVVILFFSFFIQYVFYYADLAAAQLMDKELYINAVLGN